MKTILTQMKFILFFLLCGWAGLLQAQIEDYMNSKKYSDIFEVTSEYQFEYSAKQPYQIGAADKSIRKLLPCSKSLLQAHDPKGHWQSYDDFFKQRLFDDIMEGGYTISSASGKPMTVQELKDEIITADTITIVDPSTYETSIEVGVSSKLYDPVIFRITQLLAYETKKARLMSVPIKLTAIALTFDGQREELFTIDLKSDPNGTYSLSDKGLAWAHQTIDPIRIENIKVLKGDLAKFVESEVVEAAAENRRRVAKVNPGCYDYYVWKQAAKDLSLIGLDTIRTVDPETYETRIEIKKADFTNKNSLAGLNLKQRWYFHPTRNEIQSEVISFGIIQVRKNAEQTVYRVDN